MDNTYEEYKHYWETNMFLQHEELDSWGGLEEAFSGYHDDSSSPDGGGGGSGSSSAKNVVLERNRRMKLNERLYALRSIVPNITKMDKASIIKDAINYIQELQEQERRIKTEIAELESSSCNNLSKIDQDYTTPCFLSTKKKKPKLQIVNDSRLSATLHPINLLELRVSQIEEKTAVVSLTCNKSADTIVKLSAVLESLKLNVVTTNITSISDGRLMNTLYTLHRDEEETKQLEIRIRTAIEKYNDPDCSN